MAASRMDWMRLTSRLARMTLLALLVGGCYGSPDGSASADNGGETSRPSVLPSASVAGRTPPVASPAPPAAAAGRLLDAESASYTLAVVREKRPEDPAEMLIAASGRLEPRLGRGQARYDLTGLVAPPGTAAPSSAPAIFELVWTTEDLFVLGTGEPAEWQSRPRDEARHQGGLVGRLPDEVIGLVGLVANSRPADAVSLGEAGLDGAQAALWLVRVPVEAAAVAGVPADIPNAAAIREAYGVTTVDVQAWLVGGELRRLRVVFTRENAPYGGPDRTTTTYDWRETAPAAPIVVPTGS